MKIISLVPSLTELLLHLNLQTQVIGRTKFCIHPAEEVQSIPKIGGTKNVNVAAVLDLNPDLILANKEENTKADVEALQSEAHVHVTEISNYTEALQAIKEIGQLTDREKEADALIEEIESRFSVIKPIDKGARSVCYLIWKDPYMTIGNDTYIHGMLNKCGYTNSFGDQTRYPTVSVDKLKEKNPDYVFLSSEPFPFKGKHIDELAELLPDTMIVLVDGEYFSWYGSRMVEAAGYFGKLVKKYN